MWPVDITSRRKNRPPVVLLLGGGAHVGKSTVALRVAESLGIPGIVSTDYIREAAKDWATSQDARLLMLPSYRAWEALFPTRRSAERVIQGFLAQSQILTGGIANIVTRAVNYGESVIVEGIYIVPSLLARSLAQDIRDNVNLIAVLAVRSLDRHTQFILDKEKTTRQKRSASTYIRSLRSIRAIHDYLVADARKSHVPIVWNSDLNRTTRRILALARRRWRPF